SSFLLLSFSIILPYLIVDLKLCNRTIKSLPASFVYDLSLASSMNMTDVYEKLLILENEYDQFTSNQQRKVKKQID
ncbi:hypothetical protein SJ828_13975, partial [Enterococcus faecium]